jgi:hypothetical protein
LKKKGLKKKVLIAEGTERVSNNKNLRYDDSFYTSSTAEAPILSLEKREKQLRIDAGNTDEDDLIASYISAQ